MAPRPKSARGTPRGTRTPTSTRAPPATVAPARVTPSWEGDFFDGANAEAVLQFDHVSWIDAGSYGRVVRALDGSDGNRPVAIKRIGGIFASAREALYAAREVRLLAAMRHPNIIKMRSVLPPDTYSGFDELFIVMDYGGANDLRKLLDANKP